MIKTLVDTLLKQLKASDTDLANAKGARIDDATQLV